MTLGETLEALRKDHEDLKQAFASYKADALARFKNLEKKKA